MPLPHLDTIDQSILNLLQQDGLLTYKEIAHKVKRSMTSVVERIKYLKEEGYIKKTVALIDIQKVRSLFIAIQHVQLTLHSEEVLSAFQHEMDQLPEVMECYHLTGHFDFMIKIAVSDMVAYNDFLRQKVGCLPYVKTIQSFLVLSQSKHETAYHI